MPRTGRRVPGLSLDWVLVLLVVIIFVGIAAWWLASWSATRAVHAEWEQYRHSLEARGEPLTFDDIQRQLPDIAEKENGALVVEGMRKRLEHLKDGETNGVIYFDRELEWRSIDEVAPAAIEASQEFLDSHAQLVQELRALDHCADGRLPVEYGSPYGTIWVELPSLRPWTNARRLLQLDGTLALLRGDTNRAAADVGTLLRLGATLKHEPTLIPRLVQIAIDNSALDLLGQLLNAAELDSQWLIVLERELAARMPLRNLRLTMQLERVAFLMQCDALASGKVHKTAIPDSVDNRKWSVAAIRRNQLYGSRQYDRLLNSASDGYRLYDTARKMDQEHVDHAGRTLGIAGEYGIFHALFPSFTRAFELDLRRRIRLDCARVAVAVERYRIAHGRTPSTIEDLVPDFLAAVPSDPVDGEPLRLIGPTDGSGDMVFYSIGVNRRDDHGQLSGGKRNRDLPDIGFRLRAPGSRRPDNLKADGT